MELKASKNCFYPIVLGPLQAITEMSGRASPGLRWLRAGKKVTGLTVCKSGSAR